MKRQAYEKFFTEHGYPCAVSVDDAGFHHGYVGVPEGHPLYGSLAGGRIMDAVRNVPEPFAVSFAGHAEESIGMDGFWVLRFDCNGPEVMPDTDDVRFYFGDDAASFAEMNGRRTGSVCTERDATDRTRALADAAEKAAWKEDLFAKKALHAVNERVFDVFPAKEEEWDEAHFRAAESCGGTFEVTNADALAAGIADAEGFSGAETEAYVAFFRWKTAALSWFKRGLWLYAYELTYDPETGAIMAHDRHEAYARAYARKNRPYVALRIEGQPGEIVCKAEEFEDILGRKGIDPKAVRWLPGSLRTWYCYVSGVGSDGDWRYRRFVRQTDAVAEARRNAPMDDLWREDVNVQSHGNDFGFTFAIWQDRIVEEYCGAFALSDGMTDEDYAVAMAGYAPDSVAAREVRRIHEADGAKVEEAAGRVREWLDRIGRVVREHRSEILTATALRMGLPADATESDMRSADAGYGLDCGDVRMYFKDGTLKAGTVKTAALKRDFYGAYADGTLSVAFPYVTQSTTVQRYEAEALENILSRDGVLMGHVTVLD